MRDKAHDMIKAALAADSLALGVHWIYDLKELEAISPRVDRLLAPGPGSYHPGRKKGEFTHYGDQALVLLTSLSAARTFDLNDFFHRWQTLFQDYDGYVDSATRTTLNQVAKGLGPDRCGSMSNDLAGAARAVAAAAWLRADPQEMVRAVRAQTLVTHQDEETVNAAEFFGRVSLACLEGQAPSSAMAEISREFFDMSAVSMWVDQGLGAAAQESRDAVLRFGQSCHTPEAFPGVVQIIARYEENLSEALIQSVMAGGDNAARASLVAQVLAAYRGMDELTRQWFEGLAQAQTIRSRLAGMP